MSYLKDREIWLSNVPTGNPPAGYFWKFIQNGKVVVRDSSGNNQMMIATSGSQAITGSLTVTEGITGTVSSASYVEYSGVANKPTLVSGSSQITYSGLTGIPSGIVSGSSQVTFLGLSSIPSGIVSGSGQVDQFGYATTGSNGFNGSQSITGSLTVTGQVIAQTLNVQQVTSSIVYSSGSNIFGNTIGNVQSFTGSLQVSGSSHYLRGNVGIGEISPATPLHISTTGLPAVRLTLGSEARVHNISGVNNGRDLNISPFRHFSVQTGNGIAEGQITLNAYEDIILGTGASYTPRLTISPTGAATFSNSIYGTSSLFGSDFLSNETSKVGISFASGHGQINSWGANTSTYGGLKFQLSVSNGSTFNALTLTTTGSTFSNTETTLNFNPQTNLLASYYYLNFGGGSIMYRNTTDIYFGSNAKYGSAGTVVANYTSANGMGLLTMDGGMLRWQANNTSVTAGTAYSVPIRFAINGDGNVGIGTTTPASRLNVAGAKTNSADLSNGANQLAVTDTTATAVGVGGRISFLGSYTATPDYIAMGAIEVLKDNTNNYGSSGWNNAAMRFIVGNNDNDANAGRMLERMRITSAGSLLVGTTNVDIGGSVPGTIIRCNGTIASAINMTSPANYQSPFAADRMNTAGDGLMYGMWRVGIFQAGIGATNTQSMTFITAADGSNVNQNIRMTITTNGSIGAPSGTNIYNPSDLRLKKNITTISNGLEKISALNPVKFNWIDGFEPSEDGKDMLGFVAQEVYNIIPEAVESFGGNSLTIGDTIIDNPLRVNEKFVIPVLVKAMQEQQTLIESLKSRIEILEQ